MATFFSDTDISTLEKEGKDTKNFVSLIINNKGEYTAAVTTKQKVTTVIDNDNYLFGITDDNGQTSTVTEEIMYSKLNIINEFEHKYDDVEELKLSKSKVNINAPSNTGYFQYKQDTTYKPTFYPQDFKFPNNSIKFSSELWSTYNVKDIAVKIMLGSINVAAKSVKVNDILPKLDALYTKTFGSLTNASFWFESYIDYIINYFDSDNLDHSSLKAQQLIDYFTSLNTNSEVINLILDILNIYIE